VYGVEPLQNRDRGFESRSRFTVSCCPVYVEALLWADTALKES